MKNWNTSAIACTSMLAGTLTLGSVGCQNKTEGERTEMQARDLSNAADMIKRGEAKQVDGKEMIARGQALKDQGKQVDGQQMIDEGTATEKEGDALVDQGKSMRDKAKM